MRVLVVEDERRLATASARGLADHGYAVELAHDAAAGYRMAIGQDFDAIVLDIMLAALSSYEGGKRLGAKDVWTPTDG